MDRKSARHLLHEINSEEVIRLDRLAIPECGFIPTRFKGIEGRVIHTRKLLQGTTIPDSPFGVDNALRHNCPLDVLEQPRTGVFRIFARDQFGRGKESRLVEITARAPPVMRGAASRLGQVCSLLDRTSYPAETKPAAGLGVLLGLEYPNFSLCSVYTHQRTELPSAAWIATAHVTRLLAAENCCEATIVSLDQPN